MSRPLAEIGRDIRVHWPKPYFGAVPYLQAMCGMDSIESSFGYDSGRTVVLYFLSNAGTWKGPEAKRLKAELNALLKESK